MAPFRGRLFDDAVFWEIQGTLYALEFFDLLTPTAVPANAAATEVILRFAVRERPVVSRINFTGNSGIRRNELLDVVSTKINDFVNNARISIDEQAIINKYIERGYPDVTVRSETQSAGENTILLTFTISEGDRITIEEFRFENNTVFSARTLRGQLSLRAKSLINDGAPLPGITMIGGILMPKL
jgi:outer membrane protein insertion porin family